MLDDGELMPMLFKALLGAIAHTPPLKEHARMILKALAYSNMRIETLDDI